MPVTNTLTPPLDALFTQLDAAASRARNLVDHLPPALLGRRPAPESWSVAECLAHLTLTTDAFAPLIRQALDEGRSRRLLRSGASFRMGISARLLALWLEPPYRLKSRAPAAFVPGLKNPESALPDFLDRQQQLLALLSGADGLALDRLRLQSPFVRRMHYNVYGAFCVIAIHQRRHRWQAEQVAKKLLPEP
jgi:hypothetical protein